VQFAPSLFYKSGRRDIQVLFPLARNREAMTHDPEA